MAVREDAGHEEGLCEQKNGRAAVQEVYVCPKV